ncbi:acyltransferase domain-containing protein [Streptomyces sp. NPDC051041]|uniref:acyltransferase domain-containing protein n=1 Tax=Streptomyces sp. NPDC051041 TaxID=3365640 RepID=UPI0037B28B55
MLTPVFLFAGQGSRYHGMGRWLCGADPVLRDALDFLDAVVRDVRGDSVVAAVHGDGHGAELPMTRLSFTQPAVFMVGCALARMLRARGFEPELVLGAGLGEVVAATVAGMFDPEECLRSLLDQVALFEAQCPRGGMLAVLADAALVDRDPALAGAHLAAINAPDDFVLAGPADRLDAIERHLTASGVLCRRLPVLFPFHSPLIDGVRGAFTKLVGALTPRPATIPLICGTTGAEVHHRDPDHFWQVLREPFDLSRALEPLLARDDLLFLDLGPSGSMADLVRARLPRGSRSRVLPLLFPFARDEVLYQAVLDTRSAIAAPTRRTEVTAMTVETPAAAPATPGDGFDVDVFPGQGAQAEGMGRDLFDRFPELVERADAVLGYSIRGLCLEDPGRDLRDTRYTQPALYVVDALTWPAALQEGGRLPDYLLGHGLGEFAALFAAGVYGFETGLRLVAERGRLMGQVTGGTMAAVSAVDADLVREVLRDSELSGLDIANCNAPTQTVIAGPADAVNRALALFRDKGARCAPLNVSAPFHSRYMAQAAQEFGRLPMAMPFGWKPSGSARMSGSRPWPCAAAGTSAAESTAMPPAIAAPSPRRRLRVSRAGMGHLTPRKGRGENAAGGLRRAGPIDTVAAPACTPFEAGWNERAGVRAGRERTPRRILQARAA